MNALRLFQSMLKWHVIPSWVEASITVHGRFFLCPIITFRIYAFNPSCKISFIAGQRYLSTRWPMLGLTVLLPSFACKTKAIQVKQRIWHGADNICTLIYEVSSEMWWVIFYQHIFHRIDTRWNSLPFILTLWPLVLCSLAWGKTSLLWLSC